MDIGFQNAGNSHYITGATTVFIWDPCMAIESTRKLTVAHTMPQLSTTLMILTVSVGPESAFQRNGLYVAYGFALRLPSTPAVRMCLEIQLTIIYVDFDNKPYSSLS